MTHRYDPCDTMRFVTEPPKTVTRSAFARDRARVVHSSAFRRLGGKTQVLGAGHDDFVRTRLTHSLEVAQVGREIAGNIGCDPDIVDTACLAHDIGHPPFGHHGESVLNDVASEIGGFEGNAQSLRVLTRLEPKVVDASSDHEVGVGLNLTRATLDACTKYPWLQGENPDKPTKFGAYTADADVFQWLREGAEPFQRCLEAQVMDLADDIAYSVHDVEDAIAGGFLAPEKMRLDNHRDAVCEIALRYAQADAGTAAVDEALARLECHPQWLVSYAPSRASLAALKDFTSQMIGRFALSAREATLEAYGPSPLVRYEASVVVPPETLAEMAVLKAMAVHFVMDDASRVPEYDKQGKVIRELVDFLTDHPGAMQPMFRHDADIADSDADRLRVVIDQVSVLTDNSALAWHSRLLGR